MGLSIIPTETEGSLGIDKADISARPNSKEWVSAAEYNRLKKAVAEMAASLGLGDGSTDGSIEQLRQWASSLERVKSGEFVFFDDFLHFLDSDHWLKVSSGSGFQSPVDGGNALATAANSGAGLVSLDTTASATDAAGVAQNGSINAGMSPRFVARVRTPVMTGVKLSVGLSNNNVFSADYASLIADPSTGWGAHVISSEGGSSEDDPGVLASANDTWYELAIEVDDGSEARFYIDGSLVSTITTAAAIPQGTDRLKMLCRMDNTLANARQALIDYMGIRGTRR